MTIWDRYVTFIALKEGQFSKRMKYLKNLNLKILISSTYINKGFIILLLE